MGGLDLVKELLTLNDENLAERVIKDSDVQWCLSELYDILQSDVVPVVRCKDCKHARQFDTKEPKYKCVHICRYGATQWLDSNDF